MPSPFPGMDPYAERPDLWPELHNPLAVYARDALQPVLPEGYVARLELRIYFEREPSGSAQTRVPDVEVLRTVPSTSPAPAAVASGSSIAAIGEWVPDPLLERREAYVTIRSLSDDRLVTAIEILSPSNKRPGGGRLAYLEKQTEMLDTRVNLVEIDLLRAGLHSVAVSEDRAARLRPFDYLTCVYRGKHPSGFEVIRWIVRQSLPPVPVPLDPDDAELRLDLQALFTRAYDNAALGKLADYTVPPDPPLRAEDVSWAEELLRSAGLGRDAPRRVGTDA